MKKIFLLTCLIQLSITLLGQGVDSTQTPAVFSGVITATNNGISLLPNFSLNKPALLFDLSLGKGRLSFDPMLRFGMDGKPWTLVFWWRYKFVTSPKFNFSLGAHPAFAFKTVNIIGNGTSSEQLIAQRYVAWEATPTWVLSKKVSVGAYYLGGHGLTRDLTQLTTFLTLRGILSNINLSRQLRLTLIPQLYFLKQDKNQGVYVNGTIVLGKKDFPLTISSIISQAIDTEIPGKQFIWNLGLAFNFNEKYVQK